MTVETALLRKDLRVPNARRKPAGGRRGPLTEKNPVPTLFRFLFVCASGAVVLYAAMWALAVFVEPREREVTVRIPSERLNPAQP